MGMMLKIKKKISKTALVEHKEKNIFRRKILDATYISQHENAINYEKDNKYLNKWYAEFVNRIILKGVYP